MPWVSDEDFAVLRRAKAMEDRVMESFRIKSECSQCGYQSTSILPEQNLLCPLLRCSGAMVQP